MLNFARFKLGAMCGGGAIGAIAESAKYAATRRQFGQPIASFGAIKHKLGEMVVRTYAIESLLYRTAGLVDARIAATPHDATDGSAALAAFEEYAVEASIAKVAGSEALNYVLDENIQIHGGNGYVHDYPAERHFRDARVNRIFEGTNEINRLLIPGMLIRRALKGDLPLIPAAKALQDELLGPPSMPSDGDADGVLADELRAVASFKKTALMVFGLAMQTFGTKLTDEQEVLMHLADIAIDVFSAESAVLRAQAASDGEGAAGRAARRRRARVRQRRGDADRRVGAPGARRDGRRRHAAHDARRAAPAAEGDADQHGRGSAAPRRRDGRAGRLSARVGRMGWMGWRAGSAGWAGQAGCEYGDRGRMLRPARPARPAGPALRLVLVLLLTAACSSKPPDEPKDYVGKIAAERAAKDAAFAASDDPIPTARHAQFLPLAYFPIDPDYNAPGALKPIDDKTIYEMPTSTGANRKMRRVGSLEFTLKGQPMKLLAFNEVGTDPGSLFVAFSDLTSGTETYAAGRFMDLGAQRDRHLRGRLQPRLHSVLLLQPDLRVPLSAAGESAEDSDSRRRENEVGSQKWELRIKNGASRDRVRLRRRDREQRAAPLPRLSRRPRRRRRRADRARLLRAAISASTMSARSRRSAGSTAPPGPARRSRELVARKAVRLEELERDVSVLFPGAADAIRRAAAALPIAIASGARGDEIRRVLTREQLIACFTAIVAAEDTPVSKPAPDPYLRALALLAPACGRRLRAADCVAIEDSHWGLESARAAGLRTVAVTNTYAADELTADLAIPSLEAMDLDLLARLCSE